MKRIYILRHGKSDWHADYGEDHDRPLAKRGREAAALMGGFLRRIDQIPDRVLSSTARRARHTAETAIEAGEWSCGRDLIDSLYGSSVRSALDLIRSQENECSSVLLVGHQPTLSELIAELTGGAAVRLPTAALARIDFATPAWPDIQPGQGELVWLVTPKLLIGAGIER